MTSTQTTCGHMPHYAKLLCAKCYMLALRPHKPKPKTVPSCGHPDRRHYSLGLCRSCYDHGRPKDPIKQAAYNANRYRLNPDRYKASAMIWNAANMFKIMLNSARRNAARKNIAIDIDEEFLQSIYTPTCPILGMLLVRGTGTGKRNEHSPSLDRIDSTKGYIRGNVQIISWRANRIKNDSTPDELEAIAKFMRGQR